MMEVLGRAALFIGLIALGWLLRRTGILGPNAFPVISKLVLRGTLPAAIIASFSGREIDPSMLIITLISTGCGLLYMLVGWLVNLHAGKRMQAFGILNMAGYNIGNFAMPFAQSFLGPMGVITTSLYDVGNAFVVFGTSYSMAAMIQDGVGFSIKRVAQKLIRSVPFLCLCGMTILSFCHVMLPAPVVTVAGWIGGCNAYLSMLMIGVGFRLEINKAQLGMIAKMMAARYGVAVVIACVLWFLTPFDLQVRQAMLLLTFSPISVNVVAYTQELKNDVGLSSAVNSVSLLISIVIMVVILVLM